MPYFTLKQQPQLPTKLIYSRVFPFFPPNRWGAVGGGAWVGSGGSSVSEGMTKTGGHAPPLPGLENTPRKKVLEGEGGGGVCGGNAVSGDWGWGMSQVTHAQDPRTTPPPPPPPPLPPPAPPPAPAAAAAVPAGGSRPPAATGATAAATAAAAAPGGGRRPLETGGTACKAAAQIS